jgi:hypothetical protein
MASISEWKKNPEQESSVEADSKQSSAGFLLHLLFESEDEG